MGEQCHGNLHVLDTGDGQTQKISNTSDVSLGLQRLASFCYLSILQRFEGSDGVELEGDVFSEVRDHDCKRTR